MKFQTKQYNIIMELFKNKMRFNQIKNSLKINSTQLSRYLKYLIELELIKKDLEKTESFYIGYYELTEKGIKALPQLQNIFKLK